MSYSTPIETVHVLFLKGGSYGISEQDFDNALSKLVEIIWSCNEDKPVINTIVWDGDQLPIVEYKKDLGFTNLLPFLKDRFPHLRMVAFKGAQGPDKIDEKIYELITATDSYREKTNMPFNMAYSFFKQSTYVINISPNHEESVTIHDTNFNMKQINSIVPAIKIGNNLLIITPKWKFEVLGSNVMKIMKYLDVNSAKLVNVVGGDIVQKEISTMYATNINTPGVYPDIEYHSVQGQRISATFDRVQSGIPTKQYN
jgi:hypothetical protein